MTTNQGLVLRHSVVMQIDRRQQTVTFYGSAVLRIQAPAPRFLDAIDRLRAGISEAELESVLGRASANALVSRLEEHRLVRRAFVNQYVGESAEHQVALLSDFVNDPNAAQQGLSKAHVALVGCGGTGMVALQQFVGAGVGEFTLIDPDVVSRPNLNRQFVPSALDIGREKVDVCAEYVRARSPDARVHQHRTQIHALQDLRHCFVSRPDIVVCCADSPPTIIRAIITEYALEAATACVFGGVGVTVGNVGPLLAEEDAKRSYLTYLRERLERAGVEEPPVVAASIGPTNSIVAAFMSWEVIKFLVGVEPLRTHRAALEIVFDGLSTRVLREW